MSDDARRQMIEGLREVAAFYESNPGAYYDGMTVVLRMFSGGRSATRDLASTAVAFGDWDDLTSGEYVAIARDFGARVRVEFYCPRAKVCHRAVLRVGLVRACRRASEEECIPERLVEVEGQVPPASFGFRDKP